jgi:hypothetical protein
VIIGLLAWGCGGNVTVDNTGAGGGGGAAQACPNGPGDQDIQELVGKPCSTAAAVCASNNGCGGCSVTCTGGVWVSTDQTLCFSIGMGC